MSASNQSETYTELTADIVSAYVANNSVPAAHLPELIATIHQAVSCRTLLAPAPEPRTPAVNSEALGASRLHNFIGGRQAIQIAKASSLMTHYGMTPEDYRQKWDLPADYPMVAPNYAATRSELAKKMGLGHKRDTKVKAKASELRASKLSPVRNIFTSD